MMKFCPYCGASLPGSAISFCMECGQSLTVVPKNEQKDIVQPSNPKADEDTANDLISSSISEEPVNRRKRKEKRPKRLGKPKEQKKEKRKKRSKKNVPIETKAADEGYDGYYDDVKPVEKENHREGLEPELIKRIIFIAAGAVLLVIFSVAVMYVL